VPYLTNPSQAPLRQFAFSEQFTGAVWPKPNQNGHATIRNDRYKLIHWYTKSDELYDLQADPFETNNLLKGTLTAQEKQNHQALLNEIGRLRSPQARSVSFGPSTCVGSAGVPAIAASGPPKLGGRYDVQLTSAAASRPAALLVGFSSTRWLGRPLPLDLSTVGAGPGCVLSSSGEIGLAATTSATGDAAVTFTVPWINALVDHPLFHAWLVADPSAPGNSLGVVSTGSLAAVLGL
jgi:hypothetical protein